MDPIAASEPMTRGDEVLYVPLMFGYSNYARPGYRQARVRFGDAPQVQATTYLDAGGLPACGAAWSSPEAEEQMGGFFSGRIATCAVRSPARRGAARR
jgi:multiple sugar transport system substrate-binding protein